MNYLNRAFRIGIILNTIFVITEFVFGYMYDSAGLMSDAGHNLGDVASLLLSMFAYKLSALASNKRYTYGYKKSTILISLLNAVILLIAVGMIITDCVMKLSSSQHVEGDVISIVAGIGVVVNAVTAWLFMKDRKHDLNIKSAFLHMAADTLVSIGVVISGLVIMKTGWYMIDPIIGLVVAIIIIISTWNLLSDSIRLSLDGVPKNIDYEKIAEDIETIPYVVSMHHLHIWALSTTDNALTAHIILKDFNSLEDVKSHIKDKMREDGISHVTLEFEKEGVKCCEQRHVL